MKHLHVVALAALLAGSGLPAFAEDGKKAGDIMVRARGLMVMPDESARITAIGGDVDIRTDYIPEIDISYFFTDSIAVEVIAGTSRHGVRAKNTTIGNVDLGKVSLLPPTVLLQYHPMPKSRFSPYVGAGINYTFFYDASAPGLNIDYDNGFGFAFQAGLDVQVSGNWYANVDVKKLFLNTDVSINRGAIRADVDIDPWIFGVGIGYKF